MIWEFRPQNQSRTRPCPRAESRRDPSPDQIYVDSSCERASPLPKPAWAGHRRTGPTPAARDLLRAAFSTSTLTRTGSETLASPGRADVNGDVERHERLGGILNYYYRSAA